MGLFNKLFGKRNVNNTSDESRQHSLEIRQMNAELRKIEHQRKILEQKMQLEEAKQELLDMQEEFYGEDEEEEQPKQDIDTLLFNTLAPLLTGVMPTTSKPNVDIQKINFTDEEIKEILNKFPKTVVKQIKTLNMDLFEKLVYSNNPNISRDSVIRAHALIQDM